MKSFAIRAGSANPARTGPLRTRGENAFHRNAAPATKKAARWGGRYRGSSAWRCLLLPGGIEAGKVAIGFGVSRSPDPLAILDDGRTATRLPGSAPVRVGLLFLGRSRQSGTNDPTTIDAEIGGLAGSEGSSVGDGRRFGCCRGGGGRRRACRVGGMPMVHLKRLGRRRRNRGGENEEYACNNAHVEHFPGGRNAFESRRCRSPPSYGKGVEEP
jgi:hypothetical protein